jgi:hypothetical protein
MVSIGIQTSDFGKAFLSRVWNDRNSLTERERRGFAQFVYLTVLGHLEFTISQHIHARIFTLLTGIDWEKLGPFTHTFNQVEKTHDSKPLGRTMRKMLDVINEKTQSASMGKLVEFHNEVFHNPILKRIGSDLQLDLDALIALRNIFAHGRDVWVEVEGIPPGKGILDGNPIQKPAQRLLAAGILPNLTFNTMTHGEFTLRFYSDEALLYFYKKAQCIEAALLETMDFEPEKHRLEACSPLLDLGP